MKVVAIFKWSRDPQDAVVSADGNVDWMQAKMAAGDDDHLVMEIARDIVGDGEIIGLTIGDGDKAWAAARGADRTVLIKDADSNPNSTATGEILAAAIRRIPDVDAVIIGDSMWDFGVVTALAARLGWTALAGIASAEVNQTGLRVKRKMGNAFQILDVQGPALLAVSASCSEQNPPSMKVVLSSRKKPVEQITIADLEPASFNEASSRGTRKPDKTPAQVIDGTDPAAASEQLLKLLEACGVL